MEDLYDFFRLRMVEALHKDTLDSFRVRANNALTILDELSLLLKAWIGGNIKRFETVESCISEAKGVNILRRLFAIYLPYTGQGHVC